MILLLIGISAAACEGYDAVSIHIKTGSHTSLVVPSQQTAGTFTLDMGDGLTTLLSYTITPLSNCDISLDLSGVLSVGEPPQPIQHWFAINRTVPKDNTIIFVSSTYFQDSDTVHNVSIELDIKLTSWNTNQPQTILSRLNTNINASVHEHWEKLVDEFYEESMNYAPEFSISQFDYRLHDLFSPDGENKICWPTTMANAIAYFSRWSNPPAPNLTLAADPINGDFSQQVREFYHLCNAYQSGMPTTDAVECLRAYLRASGISAPWVYLIGPLATEFPEGAKLSDYKRAVTPNDIRSALKNDDGVILVSSTYEHSGSELLNSPKHKMEKIWNYIGSHYIWVVGYDYNARWGKNFILLKIVDPSVNYMMRSSNARWDSILMKKMPRSINLQPSVPIKYFLDGSNFGSSQTQSFADSIIVFRIPQTTIIEDKANTTKYLP